MKLKEIVERCNFLTYDGSRNPEIINISDDSRRVKEGFLFIAIEGYRDNGFRYIDDAIKRGAEAIVVEERFRDKMKVKDSLAVAFTSDARKCALHLSRMVWDYPSRSFTLIGVTGTNGKTTVTYLIESILKEDQKNPGVIGTISYRYNDVVKKAVNTTPDPVDIQSLFSEMREGGVTHVIMEVSSHALVMERVLPEDYEFGIFTNLSQDHLDFHKTMEDYFLAKAKLFEGMSNKSVALINNDDEYGRRLFPIVKGKKVTYGIETPSDYEGKCLSLSIDGSIFEINGREYKTHLVGLHNLYNILSAYALMKSLGTGEEPFIKALGRVKSIPGRFERAVYGRDYHVFVDYAHTPDALDHLLDAANSLKEGRIITVFGCGGDRDRGKRPIMGSIAERKSDIVVVTSDNPRSEGPLKIIDEIKSGMGGDNHFIIPDRKEAIYRAISMAQKKDIVLIAGKGHEDYQILGDKRIHFDDGEVVREAVNDLGK